MRTTSSVTVGVFQSKKMITGKRIAPTPNGLLFRPTRRPTGVAPTPVPP